MVSAFPVQTLTMLFYDIDRFMADVAGTVAISATDPIGFSPRLSCGLCMYRPQMVVIGDHDVGIRTIGDIVDIRDSDTPCRHVLVLSIWILPRN